jgi:site-specific DNA-methyltransferase (adenine-specific)
LGKGPFPDVQTALDKLDEIGRISWPKKEGGTPMFMQYKDDLGGVDVQDLWTDIGPIPPQSPKRLGYPTQKPAALLDRIIEASSDEGDWVLDPFCGCGTAIFEANELKRNWIGIDITHLAISIMKSALREMKVYTPRNYQIIGEPTTFNEAQGLAKADKYQFQWWSLSLLDARPIGAPEGSKVGKKGADRGRDGYLTFKEGNDPNFRRIIIQAKGGENVGASDVRDLIGTVNNWKAAMGILITLDEPTEPMKTEARDAEYYESPTWGRKYPKIQIVTVKQLLEKKWPEMPFPNPFQ